MYSWNYFTNNDALILYNCSINILNYLITKVPANKIKYTSFSINPKTPIYRQECFAERLCKLGYNKIV